MKTPPRPPPAPLFSGDSLLCCILAEGDDLVVGVNVNGDWSALPAPLLLLVLLGVVGIIAFGVDATSDAEPVVDEPEGASKQRSRSRASVVVAVETGMGDEASPEDTFAKDVDVFVGVLTRAAVAAASPPPGGEITPSIFGSILANAVPSRDHVYSE
jgi:hypothetical protein